jgi:hypothetical protein
VLVRESSPVSVSLWTFAKGFSFCPAMGSDDSDVT